MDSLMKKKITKIKLNDGALIYGSIILMILINLSLVFNDSLWCDEAFSMILCKSDFKTLIKNVLTDAWPPFYSMASWGFAKIFGATVPVLKIFSIIPGILTMLLGATIVRKEFKSSFVSIMFITMVGLMPISLHANIEIRGYSWGMYFVTFCALLAYKYYIYGHNHLTFIGMVFMGLLAAYTHYFALISVALIYLILFILLVIKSRKNIINCLLVSIISVVAYIPWLECFLKATKSVSSGYWISEISISKFMTFFLYPFTNYFDNFGNVTISDFTFPFIVLSIVVVLLLIDKIDHQGAKASKYEFFSLFAVSVWVLTITVGFVLSRLLNPMFIGRYMYPSVGLLWLFLSLGIYRCISNRKGLILFLALVIATGCYGYAGQRIEEYENGTDEAKAIIGENFEKNIGIFSDSDYLNWTMIKYYFPDSINSENGGNIDVITDKGKRKKFMFLCTKDFSDYEIAFDELGYEINSLGEFNFDNSYTFELYLMEK